MARISWASTHSTPVMLEDVILELIKEQNEMQDMMIDMIKVMAETHPELALKYAGYANKIKQGRKI